MLLRRFLLLSFGTIFAGLLLPGQFLRLIQPPALEAPPAGGSLSQVQLPDVDISVDQVVGAGFSQPVQVTGAGDGSGRLFVVEQGGAIRILKNGQILPSPFLSLNVACCGERGLLGLAFHPDYAANGFFYVNYTRPADGATVIARYSVSANPDLANPGSPVVLLTIPQPFANHNGGQLAFGPDGYLYVGMGDGGSSGDPQNNAQNIESLLGKILRLDVSSTATYTTPLDNPYRNIPGRDEIWAIGLRNPWRFSFDRLSGDLYIGDVGQNQWEEIDFQAAGTPGGSNFGWRCREGAHNFNLMGCQGLSLVDPIAEYAHSQGQSVTGGFMYRGQDFPALQGRYFYADFSNGRIWSLYKTGTSPLTWSTPQLELQPGFNISAFGEDDQGELYVVDYSGKIRRLADTQGPSPRILEAKKTVSSPSADPLEVVTYTLRLTNSVAPASRPAAITDTLPPGLTYLPGSLQASSGQVDDTRVPTLRWQGDLSLSQQISITYHARVDAGISGSLVNRAQLVSAPDIQLELAQSLSVPRGVLTTTAQDFVLPGTQPETLSDEIRPSLECNTCHSQPIYDRWRSSLMSQAGRDPLLWAALHVANVDAPGSGEFCLRCHTSRAWLSGRSHPADGSALLPQDISEGVSCALCHRLVDPQPSTDEASAIDAAIRGGLSNPPPADFNGSAALIVDPQDRRRGPFSFSPPLAYHSSYRTNFLGQEGSAQQRARMCATCHNVSNPLLSWDEGRLQYWPNSMDTPPPQVDNLALFPIETTYEEWLHSDFASGGVYLPLFAGEKAGGVVETCQDCHMPRITGNAADAAFNPVFRDCQTSGCLPEHGFAGANTWVPQLLQDPDWRLSAPQDSSYLQASISSAVQMLSRAASISMTLTTNAENRIATVRVTNLSGHKLPTGYPEGRQMWLNLKAFDAGGALIYESGAYDPASGQLLRDPDAKVYEAKQGLTPELAGLLGLPPGESFHFVLNNTVIKDNRIPPRGVTRLEYDQPGLRPVGAVYQDNQYWDDTVYSLPLESGKVIATLYYQTSSKEYIDFLLQNGGIDGQALGDLWNDLKSPPQVVSWVMVPPIHRYLPLVGR